VFTAAILGVHLVASLFLLVFVLLHSGKGGGLSGGTSIERNLDRITIVTAVIFGLTTFWLAWKWT